MGKRSIPCWVFAFVLLAAGSVESGGDRAKCNAGNKKNNSWYYACDGAEAVFVFVHGVASNSRKAWFNKRERVYWPDLVTEDRATFGTVSIFLAGYDTSRDKYGFDDAAKDLWKIMGNTRAPRRNASVLDHDNLVFVAHSAGGIVVRKMLATYDDFQDKQIGLILFASPSGGAAYANWLPGLGDKMRDQLKPESQFRESRFLEKLDFDFRTYIKDKSQRRGCLTGREVAEGKLVGPARAVPTLSARRYFPESEKLTEFNHTEIVKPSSKSDRPHWVLQDFYTRMYGPQCKDAAERFDVAWNVGYDLRTLGDGCAGDEQVLRVAAGLFERGFFRSHKELNWCYGFYAAVATRVIWQGEVKKRLSIEKLRLCDGVSSSLNRLESMMGGGLKFGGGGQTDHIGRLLRDKPSFIEELGKLNNCEQVKSDPKARLDELKSLSKELEDCGVVAPAVGIAGDPVLFGELEH